MTKGVEGGYTVCASRNSCKQGEMNEYAEAMSNRFQTRRRYGTAAPEPFEQGPSRVSHRLEPLEPWFRLSGLDSEFRSEAPRRRHRQDERPHTRSHTSEATSSPCNFESDGALRDRDREEIHATFEVGAKRCHAVSVHLYIPYRRECE